MPKRGFGNSFQPAIDAPRLEPHQLRHCPKRKDHSVLYIAISFNFDIHQIDLNNAFLHGRLEDDVYMLQPLGFSDPLKPTHICKLINPCMD